MEILTFVRMTTVGCRMTTVEGRIVPAGSESYDFEKISNDLVNQLY